MNNRRGFTLIELLVVISIIALLISLLLPVLGQARQSTRTAQCMSSLHQLSVGYTSYSVDNDFVLMRGEPANSPDAFVRPGPTEQAIIDGALYDYASDTGFFECPSDPSENLRSYSIVGTLYGERWDEFFQRGTQFYNEILHPDKQIVFVEETDYRGDWNNGSWLLPCDRGSRYRWIDYVAAFHNNRTADNFGFMDGHVETREWEDPRVLGNGLGAQASQRGGFNALFPNSADWDWVRPRYRQLPDSDSVQYIHAN